MESAMLNSSFPPIPGRSGMVRIALMLLGAWCGVSASLADEASDIASAKSLSRAFRAVSKRILPTVVKIKATIRPRTLRPEPAQGGNKPLPDSPFENFFADQAPGFMPPDPPARTGLGSGVIIDAKGIILTNYHVVEGADEVLVELSDGKQFRAADIKADEQSDLAVLRIKADHGLPAAILGDSEKLEIGDWVLAIGHPFDLDLTVSSGIISGKARVLPSGRRADFLQTDAAINPGNSGGPLVNLDGEVVGINTAIASNSGGYQGVGFAIPANLAKWVTKQLIEKGAVQRAYLGIRIAEIRAQRADELGIDPGEGVLITDIFPDTPAARAGLRKDDRILKFAGHEVHNPRQLQEFVERTELGTSQTAQIVRDGKPQTVQVVACPLPKTFGLAGTLLQDPKLIGGSTVGELGIKIADLTKADIERFGYAGFKGVLIKEVGTDGLAGQAGIRGGMLVMQVEKKAVRSAAEFQTALKDQSLSKGVMLLVRTPDGGNRLVQLRKQ
jgi:serine protease Do